MSLQYVFRFVLLTLLACTGIHAHASTAYPSSCFGNAFSGLPGPQQNDPTIQTGTIAAAISSYSQDAVNYNFSVYHYPCPDGKAALLIQFTAASTNLGLFPTIAATQGSYTAFIPYSTDQFGLNTVHTGAFGSDYMQRSSVVVIQDLGLDYTKPMMLELLAPSPLLPYPSVSVPAYDSASYPVTSQSLPITSFLSGAYYDPKHSGEGVEIEISPDAQTLFFTWFTFDNIGNQRWLVASGNPCPSNAGAPLPGTPACGGNAPPTSTTLDLYAGFGGGFAGNFDPANVQRVKWGSMTLSFPTCNSVVMALKPTTTDSRLPTSNATLTLQRLTTAGQFYCD